MPRRSLPPSKDDPDPRRDPLRQTALPLGAEERIALGPRSFLRYAPSFFAEEEANALFETLLAEESFESHSIELFGRRVPEPRLIAWAGDLPYRYSKKTLPPRSRSPSLERLAERVRRWAGQDAPHPFNHVLLNLYRDGNDSMGLHADDEPELGPEPVVASLSLGAVRRFRLVPRSSESAALSLELGHGSLLLMGGATQEEYRHELPKARGVAEPRLNLTFRALLRAPTRES